MSRFFARVIFVTLALLVSVDGVRRKTRAQPTVPLEPALAVIKSVDIAKLGEALKQGLHAVSEGIKPFEKAPPDIQKGFKVFKIELWKVVEIVVDSEGQKSKDFLAYKASWDRAFKDVPDIADDVRAFQSSGDTDALGRAVITVVMLPLGISANHFPELAIYFNAIAHVMESVDDTWKLFFKGKTSEAVQALWTGVKATVDKVVPESWRTDKTYESVMGAIDGVTSVLSSEVLEYSRRVLESKVCYKNTLSRGRTRPHKCREGFLWDGGFHCIPHPENGADCFMPCGNKGGKCPGFCQENRVCCRRGNEIDPEECKGAIGYVDYLFTEGNSMDYHQCVSAKPEAKDGVKVAKALLNGVPRLFGTYEAHCHMKSQWNEKEGEWCLTKCPPGFSNAGVHWLECFQECSGKFNANGWGVCGTNPGELNSAILEMAGAVVWGVIKATPFILNMTQGGFDVSRFAKTIAAFIEMGKPFARPMCPMPAGYKPAPTPNNPVSFIVSHAGDARVNGEWQKAANSPLQLGGWHRQRPRYVKSDNSKAVMEWSQSRMTWRMFYDDSWFGFGRATLYESMSNTLIAPRSGWLVSQGPDPAPVVVKVESPEDYEAFDPDKDVQLPML